MNLHRIVIWIAAIGLAATAHAEAPIIPPDAVVETVSTGDFRFTEGPALAPDGSIYFTDIPNNSIHRYDPATGETTLFTDDSGGANGLMFSGDVLHACAGRARELHIYDSQEDVKSPPANYRPMPRLRFGLFDGKRFNSPNDLVISDWAVYFTDPRYGARDDLELGGEWVFVAWPDDEYRGLDGLPIIQNLVRPNGIGISPDFKTLYVNDNGGKKIWAYTILEPGKVGEGRLLNDLADLGGPDGMTVDHAGRIYTTIYGKGVLILSPDGERLGFLETGPQTTNCTFGTDGKTLYITAEQSLKRVVLNTGAE